MADVAELLDRLEALYGPPPERERLEPMDELVSCILSQHTTDATSFPTFDALKAAYPEWNEVAALAPDELANAIRKAGLANQKARTILSCLGLIRQRTGSYTLNHLKDLPPLEARDWLTSLPGVGPKTASIVLCFSFGMNVIPVDTHVYRVAWRIGLIPEKLDANKAHDALLRIVPAGDAYRFHMDLIVHGRKTCRAPLPVCGRCPVQNKCKWYLGGGPSRGD